MEMIKKYVDAKELKEKLGEMRLVDEGDPYRAVCEVIDGMWSIQMPERVSVKLLRSSVEVCDRCGYGADKHGLFKLFDEKLCWACFKDQEQKEEGEAE